MADYPVSDAHVKSADWRSKRFRALESTVSAEVRYDILSNVADSISVAFKLALSDIGHDELPDNFEPRLHGLLEAAYTWNSLVKSALDKPDFEPFTVEPGSPWDAKQMESFERVRTLVTTPVVSTVSLGLMGSRVIGKKRVPHVQLKAKVLVENWFPTFISHTQPTIETIPLPPQLSSEHNVTFAFAPPPNILNKQPRPNPISQRRWHL